MLSEGAFTKNASQAGKAYNEAVAEKGKGHGLGAPRAHIVTSVMEAILAETTVEQQAAATIKEILSQFSEGGVKHVTSCIPHCTRKPTHNNREESETAGDTKFKVEIGLDPFGPFRGGCVQAAALATAMEQAFIKLKGERLVGPPPKGPFERQLAKLLATIQKDTD